MLMPKTRSRVHVNPHALTTLYLILTRLSYNWSLSDFEGHKTLYEEYRHHWTKSRISLCVTTF